MRFAQSKIPFWVADFEPVLSQIHQWHREGRAKEGTQVSAQQCQRFFEQLTCMESNGACQQLFGVDNHQAFEVFFSEKLVPQLTAFFSSVVQAVLEEQDFVEDEVSLAKADGSDLYTILSLSLVNKGQSCLYFSAFDLTEKQRSEQELKQTLLRYELVVEGAFGAIWDWDVVAQTVHFSKAWCQMRNGTPEDFSTSQDEWVNSIHPDDRDWVLESVGRHFAGETPVFEEEYRILCLDGSVKWVADRGVVKRDDQGQVIRMAGSEFDITEKRQAQEQQRLAASVFENASDGIFILDLEGQITRINRAFSLISGYPQEQVRGRDMRDLFPDSPDNDRETVAQCPLGDEKIYTEVELRHQNGKGIPCRLSINKVYDNQQVLTHYVCLITDISQMKKDEEKLFMLAHHDHLTQLPNRLMLRQRLEEFIARAARSQKQVAVVFIDLDHFKVINDAMGHTAGDELLIEVATRLKRAVRREDVVARLGGDEFIIGIENVENTLSLSRFVENLQTELKSIKLLRHRTVRVSASFGIALYPYDGKDVLTLIRNADTAMYRAKANGRQCFEFYTQDLTEHAIHRMALESDLAYGLSHHQFLLEYQPQVELSDGRIIGVEALVRWNHPVLGRLSPDKFIPLAEESGQISMVGEWVLTEACRQARRWQIEGKFEGRMSVNVSGLQLQKGNLPELVGRILEQTGLQAQYLELELTESAVMGKTEFAINQLHELKNLGVTLAIDDFGTGYSSLSYLKRLPIHRLKIDKSFILDIPGDEQDMAISETIVMMAEILGLQVLAEGVEKPEQAEFLRKLGCCCAQGYWFSRPLRPEVLDPLLKEGVCKPQL